MLAKTIAHYPFYYFIKNDSEFLSSGFTTCVLDLVTLHLTYSLIFMVALRLKMQFVNSLTCPFQAVPLPSIRILKLQACHSTHNMQYPPPASSGSLHVVVFMCDSIRIRRTSTTHHHNPNSNAAENYMPDKLFRLYFCNHRLSSIRETIQITD